MTYRETIDFLFNSLPVFEQKGAGAYKPGLERTREFAASLGTPHEKFASLHIAGTNGKGSTSHMLASALQAAGYRTGLYTSPHLLDFRERIRVDGQMITEKAVVEFTERNRERMTALKLSFFEMATVMAFDWFAREQVDIAVVETGLGGRLDSTNIITPLVSVITNIGLEHTQYLGTTVPLIAAEKAGIIKPGVPAVIGETNPESAPVFLAKAAETGSPIVFADQRYSVAETAPAQYSVRRGGEPAGEFTLDLGGDYQRRNLATVLAAIDAVNATGRFTVTDDALRGGLSEAAASTGLMGRWQVSGRAPLVVCDTAHNAHGIAEVARQIAAQRYGKLYMVLGFVADKDLDSIIPLLPRGAHYIATQAAVGRALPAGELRRRFDAHGIAAETVAPVADAVRRALSLASPDDMVYIGGSNFTVAEALPLFM